MTDNDSGPITTLRAIATVAMTAIALAVPATAAAAIGDQFSIAPTSANGTTADAFAPSETAWWAGVCDLSSGNFAIGTDPGTRFSNCIDHPASTQTPDASGQLYLAPPLSPGLVANLDPASGSGPDGWAMLSGDGTTAFGMRSVPADGPGWRLADVTQAGTRPDGSGSFWFGRQEGRAQGPAFLTNAVGPDGQPRTITGHLPPGVIGDPTAVPKCPSEAVRTVPVTCHPNTQVGTSTIAIETRTAVYPVYNVEPRDGYVAEFVIAGVGVGDQLATNVPVLARARTEGDFGVDAMAVQAPAGAVFLGQSVTFWGVPWAASHDNYRPVSGYCVPIRSVNPFGDNAWGARGMSPQGLTGGVENASGQECSQEPVPYDNSWGPIKPFLTTQTECSPQNPVTGIESDNWHNPDVVATADSVAPLVTGCERLPFSPSASFVPTSTGADSPSGLDVDISIPANDEPPAAARFNADDGDPGSAVAHWKSDAGLATAHLEKTVVTLPEGMAVNPSGATGLAGCSDAQLGVRDASTNPPLFNNEDPFDGRGAECPAGSVIGTASATTPVLDEVLTGEFVLGEPKSTDPTSGQMLRLFLVLRNRERGLLAKVFGSTVADPVTGRLVTTFERNPRVPVDNIEVDLKGGDRGTLALPQTCGGRAVDSQFTPWSAAHGGGGPVRALSDAFTVGGDCDFGFGPALAAGMSDLGAGGHGSFSFEFTRPQGDQWLRGLTAVLPEGLLASVRGVPLCTDAQAAAGACPAGSRIGTVDASAGSGDPFVLEQKGDIYLTEGYKGGPFGLMVKVRAIAGPFRGAMELSPIVVRQAIHVDRDTAQVTAVSDPFPVIHHGVPLRVRRVLVHVNRPDFMVNPTDCSPKQILGSFVSTEGSTALASSPFQAAGCAGLPLRPRLSLRLRGRRQVADGGHPGLRAVMRQAPGEANLKRVTTRLPLSLALDPERAQADDLCEFEEGRKQDPNCPAASMIGRARAFSPLLNRPLEGPVYFVKNVRFHPVTGNPIRTLPTLLLKLSGEVDLNVRATTDSQRGKLVTTFPAIPDAAVERVVLRLFGGRRGILVVSGTNLCRRPKGHFTEVDVDGHNGRRHDFDVRMKTPCKKKPARLRVRKARWRGDRVVVRGTINPAAKRNVKLTVRCGKARTSRGANPNRRGWWKATLKTRGRCSNARKARIVARYTGGPKVKRARKVRSVRRRG